MEKCVRDLEENYAKVKLNVSKPIVSFRETIVPEASIDMVNEIIVKTGLFKFYLFVYTKGIDSFF